MKKHEILAKLQERVPLLRRDIQVVGFEPINHSTAKVAAVYYGDEPTYEEVRSWAIDVFDKQIRVLADTVAVYDTQPYKVLSFIAQRNEVRELFVQAMRDGSKVCIAHNTYLDEDLGITWEKQDIEGKSFLVRTEKDGVEALLQAQAKFLGARTSSIANQITAMVAYPDDKIRYLRPDGTVGVGVVTDIDNQGYLIVKDSGTHNIYERTFGTVLEVITPGSANKGSKADLLSLYEKNLDGKLEDIIGRRLVNKIFK